MPAYAVKEDEVDACEGQERGQLQCKTGQEDV